MVMKGLSLLMVTILIFQHKIVSAFENGTRKEVTILDMVSWIAANPGTSYNKQHEDTGF
jgi:hypothetical protein